ncbi:MAG: hypothetical protein IPP00_13590 [Actinomycetales bacterium]|jgi:predicted metal-dependent HD superfamily phosphohydrolase|uniref:Metal-dependent HD superfamily phosphohydrolase n=1 Tax=Candidatus Phosphoribacter hodrii TaxID=2953743 RepID=A0A9D7TFF3_9MICO|nr:hypothetical protein [Candidatus Phosphoribacter hodrii]
MPALISWWRQDLADLIPFALDDAVQAAGTDLLRRWAEPQRHYHRTTHLVELFWALEELEDGDDLDPRDALLGRVAGWFHDAVYLPLAAAGTNEADSARLAVSTLSDLGADADDVSAIERLVHLSATHDGDALTSLDRAFLDADLWILSADPDRFDDYCEQVRQEYAAVPDAAYRAARAEVLRGFAQRPRLYLTDFAAAQWEPQARNNLDREIARLDGPDIDGA